MKVKWTRRALTSLGLIADYIAKDNPTAANRTVNTLFEAATRLGDSPRMGRRGRVEGTRELVISRLYIMPYRIENNEVQILHIFHAKRKWPDKL